MNRVLLHTMPKFHEYSETFGTKYNCPDYRGVLILEVHFYCIGTATNCPDYRGVLIIEVSLSLSVHNSRFDCNAIPKICEIAKKLYPPRNFPSIQYIAIVCMVVYQLCFMCVMYCTSVLVIL